MLGLGQPAQVRKDTCTLIADAGSAEDVKARVASLKKELAESTSVYDSEKISERIAKLSGGVAVIKARGASAQAARGREGGGQGFLFGGREGEGGKNILGGASRNILMTWAGLSVLCPIAGLAQSKLFPVHQPPATPRLGWGATWPANTLKTKKT